ncbi:MAG TPA: alkaline phosphatase family protein [Thermoanaerobaculia bacterium]
MRSLSSSPGPSHRLRRAVLWSSVPLLLALMGAAALRKPSRGAHESVPVVARAPRIAPPIARRVLLVVLDAWRRETALDDSRMPYVASLAQRGSRGPILSGPRTFTKACVRELLTGQRSGLSESTRNLISDTVSGQSVMTRVTEARMAFTMIDAFEAFGGLFSARFSPSSVRKVSIAGLPRDPLDLAHDAIAEAAAIEALRDPAQRLVVVHLESLDLAGHVYTPHGDAYQRVVRAADERLERLAASVDLHVDALVVVGDHGSDDQGHHGGPDRQARETAYLAVGAGIRPGAASLDPLDFAATLTALLGLCPPEQSVGAPEEELLAGDPRALKTRCDACLRDRLDAAAGVDAISDEARAYFAAPVYTSSTAELYKALLGAGEEPPRSRFFLAVAIAALLVGLVLLRERAGSQGLVAAWAVPVSILVMAVSTERDLIAIVLYAAALLLLVSRELNPRGTVAVATTLLVLIGARALIPSADAGPFFRAIGLACLLAASAALAPGVLQPTRLGRVGLLVLTSVLAAAAATQVRSDQIPGHFSWRLTLIDYALATGVLFLFAGLILRERAVLGIGALALAGCFFQGLPLAVFALLTLVPTLGRRPLRAPPFLPAALFAPLGALALLRAQNGGYGFSRIDLSLFALGIPWVGEPNYLWGAAVILLSYLVPLILAVLLGQRFHGIARASLGAIVAAFLIFAGADLFFLSLPGGSPVRVARLEEVFVFDVIFGFLALILFGSASALARLRLASPSGAARVAAIPPGSRASAARP